MFCKNCGKEIPNDASICPDCGAEQVEMIFCQHCGKKIPKDSLQCPGCKALIGNAKFCQHCGSPISKDCVVCPKCGKQVSELSKEAPQQIVINNSSVNTNTNTVNAGAHGREKNKWVALVLCFFFGLIGVHKFYEGKIGMGIIYILTLGLFGIGALIDFIVLLFKPNPYYV